MDSTACLVRSDTLQVNLAFRLLPVGQNNMQENNPVSCHGKREMSLVAAWLNFPRFPKHWSHSRMRHVRLEREMRSAY